MQISANGSVGYLSASIGIEIVYFMKQISKGPHLYWFMESGGSTSKGKSNYKKIYNKAKKKPSSLLSNPDFDCAICIFGILSNKKNKKPRSYEGEFNTGSVSGLGLKGFISKGGGFLTGGGGKNWGNSGFTASNSIYTYVGNVGKIFNSIKNKVNKKAKKYYKKLKKYM